MLLVLLAESLALPCLVESCRFKLLAELSREYRMAEPTNRMFTAKLKVRVLLTVALAIDAFQLLDLVVSVSIVVPSFAEGDGAIEELVFDGLFATEKHSKAVNELLAKSLEATCLLVFFLDDL